MWVEVKGGGRSGEPEVNHWGAALTDGQARAKNRWATREDLQEALRSALNTNAELYSDPLNISTGSHTYHSLYTQNLVFSSSGNKALVGGAAAAAPDGVRSQARRYPLTSPWWALETP
jgi:hypothetical protein